MRSLKAAYFLCTIAISILYSTANDGTVRPAEESSFSSSKILQVHAPEEHTEESSSRKRRTTSRPDPSITPDVVVVSWKFLII